MSWTIDIKTARPVSRDDIAKFDALYPEHRVPIFLMDDGQAVMSGSWMASGAKALTSARVFAGWLRKEGNAASIASTDFSPGTVGRINSLLQVRVCA